MHLSFEYRKNDVEIEKLEHKINEDANIDKFEKKLAKIDLEEKLFARANMQLIAKGRFREIKTWSKLKKEFNDGKFDDRNVNTHQADSYLHTLEHRRKSLTQGSSQPEVFNVLGPLATLKRLRKSGKLLSAGEKKKPIKK